MKQTFFLILITTLLTLPAQAAPTPKSKKEEIGNLEKRLEEHKEAQKVLQKEVKNLEKELQSTRAQLVKIAKSIRENEKDLSALEEQITNLENEKAEIEKSLNSERGSIANLIIALERIRRLPPQALIAKPDAPLETARSVMLLKNIIPAINKKAQALQKKLVRLDSISEDLNNKKQIAFKTKEDLKEEQITLTALSKEREKLYSSSVKDLKSQQASIKQITAQAKSLQDLVRRLDEDRRKREKNLAARTRAAPSIKQNAQLPISGIIKVRFNEPDIFGAPAQGLTIEGRGGALVVAPMGGTVRFAGYFKNYGNMVILEHENGYHSLIGGLEKINTDVGYDVTGGEPIGLLHHPQSNQKPALYYELRYKGKTINPSKIFTDLG